MTSKLNIFCRLLSFLSHLAEFLSAGFTFDFTTQRYIPIRSPFNVLVEKENHPRHYFTTTILVLFRVLYCLALTIENNYENCQEELYLSWFISDAVLTCVIPLVPIVILNALIVFHLRKISRNNPPLPLLKEAKKEISLSDSRKNNIALVNLNSKSGVTKNMTVSTCKVWYISNV